MKIIDTSIKMSKQDFIAELADFEGKEQYILSLYNSNINNILKTLETNSDKNIHISSNYRLVEDMESKSTSFKINNSCYHWESGTNIYYINKSWCTYYILHNTKNNNIMIYENLI